MGIIIFPMFFLHFWTSPILLVVFDELDEDGSGELTLDEINAAPAVPWRTQGARFGENWRNPASNMMGFFENGFVPPNVHVQIGIMMIDQWI